MAKLRGFIGLTKRNMLVFFTDKGTLFFSMLTPMIILLLYILFLKNSLLSSLKDAATGLENLVAAKDMAQFVNGLLLTGIISSALITIPYNAQEIRDHSFLLLRSSYFSFLAGNDSSGSWNRNP